MKVSELIEELKKYPMDTDVVIVERLWKKKPQMITSCVIKCIDIPLKRIYCGNDLISLRAVKDKSKVESDDEKVFVG